MRFSKKELDVALISAVARGDVKKLQTLLGDGVNVNIRDKMGRPLLHIAAEKNDLATVCLLCNYGADIDARNNYGRTVFDIFSNKHCDYRSVVRALNAKKSFPKGNFRVLL